MTVVGSRHPLQRFAMYVLALCCASLALAQHTADSRRFALRTNMLYDAVLTPDIGVEYSLSPDVSVGVEGVCAWWSRDSRHRYWRVRGLWADCSWWFGDAARDCRLTGHHAGIYVSVHDYDFEFGDRGWQSRRPAMGAGLTYGYSFRLNPHLNLDVSMRAGYVGGSVTEYKPMCGEYTCVSRRDNHYLGVTGLGVTLVWFPGWLDKSDTR